jgi:hypothetical protein
LRHAPPRDLAADELHEAAERGLLSGKLFSVEMQRRSRDARARLEGAMERYGTVVR